MGKLLARPSPIGVILLFVLLFAGCGRPDLPAHRVADDSSLAPKKGRRIHLQVDNPDISKDECIALINAYKKKAGPDGQVAVQKPSKVLGGAMAPWCVENFDGRGIFFNDNMF